MSLPVKPSASSSTSSNGSAAPRLSSGATDSLTCQWNNCGERCPSAEQLYDHVCERHVGRKSTNNLNLTCQWGTCRTTTVKRDHITSHIRVHVPLKPHKCDLCQKAFKRPQDLKKHVKTHADESVLMHDVEPQGHRSHHNGYGNHGGNDMMHNPLSSLAATANSFYQANGHSLGHSHNYSHQRSTNPSYYGGHSQPALGSVYYNVGQTASYSPANETDSRKRAFDALNDFIGDIKRRAIEPTSYYDVGQRLTTYQPTPVSVDVGGGLTAEAPMDRRDSSTYGSMSDFGGAGGIGTMIAHAVHQPQMLELPNLRTKQDLISIDNFLEQLQATVYESTEHSSAGLHQPDLDTKWVGDTTNKVMLNTQTGYTPVRTRATSQATSVHSAQMSPNGLMPVSNMHSASPFSDDTPALTPAASTSSYCSTNGGSPHVQSHSPPATHNHMFDYNPAMGMTTASTLYPQIPSVPAISEFGTMNGFTGAGGSSLAYEHADVRRFQGGRLQSAAPSAAERSLRDKASDEQERQRRVEEDAAQTLRDMSLRSSSSAASTPRRAASESASVASDDDDASVKRMEAWVENIRVVEALRAFVSARLRRGEFSEDDAAVEEDAAKTKTTPGKVDGEVAYPILAI